MYMYRSKPVTQIIIEITVNAVHKLNGLGAKPPKLGFRVHLMLLGQIWYHWKAKSLRSMNPADAKLARWAVAMETASEVQ